MTRARMIPRAAGRIAAALGAALAVLLLLAAPALALGATGLADRFRSNGDPIAGWYWLRDRGLNHYAEYTWDRPPAGDITIEFEVLATDGVNGGPGVDARFGLLVGFPGAGNMGGVFHHVEVTLQNVSPPNDPVGYTNHGFLTLPRSVLDKVMGADGALFIRVLREGAGLPHVAFQATSLRIVGPGPVLERGGSGGSALSRGGGIVIDGTVTLPEGAVEMRPELGDWGDEGICWLDRPCIGDAASGFRSTGFPGVEGWFWMRAPTVGQYADWVFETPPAGALVLDLSGLAQNVPGHVQKDTAHVLMTLGYPGSGSLGGQIGPFTVALPMLWKEPDTDIWKTRALVTIPADLAASVIPLTGGLYVHIERVDEHEPDVGFSAGSLLLYPAADIGR